MDQEFVEDLSRSQDEGSIEMIFVEDVSSLKKGGFSRREKHIEMNATNKLLKPTSKPHIKLLNLITT